MMQSIILGMGFKGGKGFPDVKVLPDGTKLYQLRDENGNLMFDQFGNPIYGEKGQIGNGTNNMFDQFGNPIKNEKGQFGKKANKDHLDLSLSSCTKTSSKGRGDFNLPELGRTTHGSSFRKSYDFTDFTQRYK